MKRTQLEAKTPLTAKARLTAKTRLVAKPAVKKPKKRLPLEKKSIPDLVKLADKALSRYIRLRDSEVNARGNRVGVCITCPRLLVVIAGDKWNPGAQNGHYIGRGNHALRYDERNCNLQCAHCNAWLDKVVMLANYAKALDEKYGEGTAKELEDTPPKYATGRARLLEVIHDCELRTELLLTNP